MSENGLKGVASAVAISQSFSTSPQECEQSITPTKRLFAELLILAVAAAVITAAALPVSWSREMAINNTLIIAGLTVAWFGFGLLLFRIRSSLFRTLADAGGPPLSSRYIFVFAAPGLIVYGITLLGVWPGLMSEDSFNLWDSVTSHQIGEFYTLGHWAFVWSAALIYPSPTFVIAVQFVLYAFAAAFFLYELGRWRVPLWVLLVFAVVFPVLPFNLLIAVTLWKDVLYAGAMIIAGACTLAIVRCAKIKDNKFLFSGYWLSLAAMIVTRLNGIAAVLLAAGISAGLLPTKRVRLTLFAVGASLGLGYVVLRSVVHPLLGVQPLAGFNAIIPIHIIGAMIADKRPFAPDELATITEVMPLYEWESGYHCQSADMLIWNPHRSLEALMRHAGDLVRIAASLTLRYPSTYFVHQACATSLLWQIRSWNGAYAIISPIVNERANAKPVPLQMSTTPILPRLYRALERLRSWTATPARDWLFWRPAIYLTVVAFMATAIAVICRNRSLLCFAVVPLANTLSLVPTIISPDYRYQLGVMAIATLTLPLLFARDGLDAAKNGKAVEAPYFKKLADKDLRCCPS